jgi:hypothetical protein
VIYLTKYGGAPSDQTWGSFNKNDFQGRHIQLSYQNHILPWLKEYVASLTDKDFLLKSAIIQYTDYLTHWFYSKEIYKNMDQELKEFLFKELGLTNDRCENLNILNQQIDNVEKLKDQLEELEFEIQKQFWEEWEHNILSNDNLKKGEVKSYYDNIKSYPKIGLLLKYNNENFSILIEWNPNEGIYYGVGRHFASEEKLKTIQDFICPILENQNILKSNIWWYGRKSTTFSNAYADFEYLAKIIIEALESTQS